MARSRRYHHGDLRRALLDAAVEVVGEVGPGAVSLREVARRAGVSHAAPAHHFGDRTGLFTALAVEGYERLAATLSGTLARTESFLEVGVAYVRFALDHRAHFEVMFRPELHHRDDPALAAARMAASEVLYAPARAEAGGDVPGDRDAGVAAWSLVHGFATLWLDGNLPHEPGDNPEERARRAAAHLFGGPGAR